jgi:hypothetical protein
MELVKWSWREWGRGSVCEGKETNPEPLTNGHDKDESGPVGVRFYERVDPWLCGSICGFRVGGDIVGCCWNSEGNPRWSCNVFLCFFHPVGAGTSCDATLVKIYILLSCSRVTLKLVISWVVIIAAICCDSDPWGDCGEMEGTQVMLGYMIYPVRAFVSNPLWCFRCHIYSHVTAVCRR